MLKNNGSWAFAQRAKARRKELGLSQKELAIKAGVTTTNVSDMEKSYTIDPERFKPIVEALGLND